MKFTLLLLISILSSFAFTQVSTLPHAPNLVIHEMENQLILTLTNDTASNNYLESYRSKDSTLLVNFPSLSTVEYKFQGYQIFQVANRDIGIEDLRDPNLARQIAQCDLIDDVDRILNIDYDSSLNMSAPNLMVEGANQGIQHSFLFTSDVFAQNSSELINFKEYFFVAVAYAYIELPYTSEFYPLGTFKQYIYSTSNLSGQLEASLGVPHKGQTENNGTEILAAYGDEPEITQHDGYGNGGRALELTEESIETIVQEGYDSSPTFKGGKGPITIKVVNPKKVKGGEYLCKLHSYTSSERNGVDSAQWTIYRSDYSGGNLLDSVNSDVAIWQKNEQIIEDWGISVEIAQSLYNPSATYATSIESWTAKMISATREYTEESGRWLDFIHDKDYFLPDNWIRAGNYTYNADDPYDFSTGCYDDDVGVDPEGEWDNIMEEGVAPFRLTGYQCDGMPIAFYNYNSASTARSRSSISYLPSVDIVFTSDKSKWTRCPVIELGRDDNLSVGHVDAGALRGSQSVKKNGYPDKTGTTGMGWFPGYAIDIESGARLYMAFGENSFQGLDNGADMIWNPSERLTNGVGEYVLGGMHAIWVMSYHNKAKNNDLLAYNYPAYIPSEAEELATNVLYQDFLQIEANNNTVKRNVYSSISWVINPLLKKNETLLSSDLTLKLRINKEYKTQVSTGWNNGEPLYSWNMEKLMSTDNSPRVLAKALECINVFPNPSNQQEAPFYENVKLINLPEQCQITIVDVKGTHIRAFSKNDRLSSLDWDLRNENGVAVSSGIYLIHVLIPGIGERTLLSSIVR